MLENDSFTAGESVVLTGADLVVAELKRYGVNWVATLCGNGLNPFFVACKKAGVRLVDTHNEQSAAYIADAYARLTGHLGVCAVSSGVAHCNALTGVANAYFDGAPVLLITSASEGYGSRRGVFQEFDQVALAAPICKFASAVNRTGDIASLTRQAISVATSGRPGPVHLTIPVDLFSEKVTDSPKEPIGTNSDTQTTGRADPGAIGKSLELIGAAQRPLLVGGTGVFYAGAQKTFVEFSEASGVPIVTPIWDRGAVDEPHPNFLGVVGAASGEPKLLADADLLILVGVQVDYRLGFLRPPAVKTDLRVIRIDPDACQLLQGIEPDLAIQADLTSTLGEMAAQARKLGIASSHIRWLEESRQRSLLFRARWTRSPSTKKPMTGRHIVEAIQPFLTRDVIFLVDGGNIGQWAHMVLAADHYPSHWLTCGASGVVGWGLPGAMAAKLAFPERPVLLLSGDGAFGLTPAEIESATRQGLPFVVIVANDRAWGIVVSEQRQTLGEEGLLASRFSSPRYAELAKALGANGAVAESVEELTNAIREGFASTKPTVIDVPISVCGPADTP
jgi:acetolactate synthase-1/2/3 large subunit